VHNGIDLRIPTLTGTERAELGAAAGEFLVGAVGNLRPAKDYGTLLKAAAIVRKSGCPVRIAIIGEGHGQLRDELLTLKRALGLDETVSFLGFRSDVPRLLCALDAFVSSSSSEGFSLSTVEALWLGKPVVVTKSGGPEEIVRHERTGLLVPPRDPAALADGILRLYRNPGLAKAMSATGARDVQALFSMARMIEAYEEVYQEALEHSRS
jgi:glycosyltransferase involved in cell wall biosynthesis